MGVHTAVILGLAAAQLAPCTPQALEPSSIDLWRTNLAEIRVEDSKNREGYGLVVGWNNGEAWIAVPSHVIWGDRRTLSDEPGTARPRVQARFGPAEAFRQACPARPNLANPTPPDPVTDVSFLCVEWQLTPLFWSALVSRPVAAKDAVELMLPVRTTRFTGSVSGFERRGRHQMILADFSGLPGQSGAPAIAASGVVGLHLGSGGGARIVSLATVQTLAAQAEVPWALQEHEFYDCRRSVRVCPDLQNGLGPDVLLAESAGGRSQTQIRLGSCQDVAEARYLLSDVSKQFICEPSLLMLRTDDAAPLRLRVTCHPDLTGTWRTPDGHTIDCVASGTVALTSARCVGLQGLGLGLMNVSLTPNGSRMTVVGEVADMSVNIRSVTGSLTWRPGVLSGTLSIRDLPDRTIELRKVPR